MRYWGAVLLILGGLGWGSAHWVVQVRAATGASAVEVSAPQPAITPTMVSRPNKPMMVLASSKDHTLFSPIYTDYEDIDGDSIIDSYFKPAYKYYGYFDSVKCYKYSKADGRFNPSSMAVVKDGKFTCSHQTQQWSGNFLNWATMSRLDVVRKMLYGGKRAVDGKVGAKGESSVTVLERANLSQDSHSFVKTYYGLDVHEYTPFKTTDLIRTDGRTENPGIYAGLTICSRSNQQSSVGDPVMRMAKGNLKMWSLVQGKVCSWRDDRYQWFDEKSPSYFSDPDKGNGPVRHEREAPSYGEGALSYGSSLGPDLFVRVRVCDPQWLGEERCQAYPLSATNNYKPFGIFQEFGAPSAQSSTARAEFGLIMGSYDLNLTAGVLRKNVEDFANEIDAQTGIFCHSATSSCPALMAGAPTGRGAIKAFDQIQLVGREGQTDVIEPEDDIDTDYRGKSDLRPYEMRDGDLPAWGNPLGEMVTQALRYLSGGSSTNPSPTPMDDKYKMPVVAWKDPFVADSTRISQYGPPACRPLYVMAMSSSALSFDDGSGPIFNSLPNRAGMLDQYVDWIGENEELVGSFKGLRSVGNVQRDFGEDCTLKQLDRLSDATGVCPEYGAFKGTWQISGASLYANTSRIRQPANLSQLPADLHKVEDALKVKTLAASLQGGVPRIEVPIPGSSPQKFVYITPESVWEGHGMLFPGAILSFQAINAGERYGSFLVSWNDRAFGGDYDMDMTGFLRYDVVDDPEGGYLLKITTDILQVTSGMTGTHGYSVMGTERDGRFLTHTHGHIATTLRGVAGNLCKDEHFTEADRDLDGVTRGRDGKPHRCNASWAHFDVFNKDLRHTETFKMVGVDDVLIHDPLWYAAKYGYGKSSRRKDDGTYEDLSVAELLQQIKMLPETWDQFKSDGSVGSDGVPDGYVLARRPELLEAQLRKTLQVLTSTSNAAAAVSSAALADGAFKYTVEFDSQAISGKIQAYRLNAQGQFPSVPQWEAGAQLASQTRIDHGQSRHIITNDGAVGVPFRWGSWSAGLKAQMTAAATNRVTEANAQLVLNYIRGDQRQEGAQGLRPRGGSLLGPIVNSTPWVQQRPTAAWGSVAGYDTFYQTHRQRPRLLWVGANDGMLHAWNSETGREVMAYVPGVLANRLTEIPLQRDRTTQLAGQPLVVGAEAKPEGSVWAYVDGNPFSADVRVGSTWHTYVMGSLGRGGKGVFALDATRVDQLTEAHAADVFKWQFTAADDPDLGYQVSDIKLHPATNQATPIARLNNGKFAWIMGNGPMSKTGKAVLFILYMDGPVAGSWTGQYRKIVVDAGTGNGLSTPRWEDLDGDGTADVVYAGDLKGNLWKFDLRSDQSQKWKPMFSEEATEASKPATPLFTASRLWDGVAVPQPITSAPELLYMASGGVMVNFGTGNAFRQGDFGVSQPRHAVYGIWDRNAPITHPKLQMRQAVRLEDGSVAAIDGPVMDWSAEAGLHGWRMDLPGLGEAVLSDPSYDAGVLSFVSTRPPTQSNLCIQSAQHSLFMVDPISGRPERAVQGNATIEGHSYLIAARDIEDPKVRILSDRRPPIKQPCTAGEPGCRCAGDSCTQEVSKCKPGQRTLSAVGRSTEAAICYRAAPRLQWREIPGIRTYP